MNAEQIKDRTIKTESDREEPVIPRLAPEPVWCAGIEKPVIWRFLEKAVFPGIMNTGRK